MPNMKEMTVEERLNYLLELQRHSNNKVPKLDTRRRKAMMAFILRGVPFHILSSHFDVSAATVKKMANPRSQSYKAIRDEVNALTPRLFIKEYTTEEDEIAIANLMRSDT